MMCNGAAIDFSDPASNYCIDMNPGVTCSSAADVRSTDGGCNNMDNTMWGVKDDNQLREVPCNEKEQTEKKNNNKFKKNRTHAHTHIHSHSSPTGVYQGRGLKSNSSKLGM